MQNTREKLKENWTLNKVYSLIKEKFIEIKRNITGREINGEEMITDICHSKLTMTNMINRKQLFKGNVTNMWHDKTQIVWMNTFFLNYTRQTYDRLKDHTEMELHLGIGRRKWINKLYKENNCNAHIEITDVIAPKGIGKINISEYGYMDITIEFEPKKGLSFLNNWDQINIIKECRPFSYDLQSFIKDNFESIAKIANDNIIKNKKDPHAPVKININKIIKKEIL